MLNTFHESGKFRIIWIHGNSETSLLLCDKYGVFDGRTHLIVSISWHLDAVGTARMLETWARNLPYLRSILPHVTFLANSPSEREGMKGFEEYGASVVYVNNCCWLDERLFQVRDRPRPVYDLVVNSKPYQFKRHYLTGLVYNKAFIAYYDDKDGERTDLSEFNPVALFEDITEESEISDILNTSMSGGIFSAVEGACYVSCEYLLCGLPVVTTRSLGGRDVFYTEENSIVCEDDPVAVREAVETLKQMDWSQRKRLRIRENTMLKLEGFRQRFMAHLELLFERYGEDWSAHSRSIRDRLIPPRHKLEEHRNFWPTEEFFRRQ